MQHEEVDLTTFDHDSIIDRQQEFEDRSYDSDIEKFIQETVLPLDEFVSAEEAEHIARQTFIYAYELGMRKWAYIFETQLNLALNELRHG